LPADHALERRNLGFVFLKKISRSGVFIERAGLKLLDPDPDQVARNVVAFRETVERLARNEFLGDGNDAWPWLPSSESLAIPVNSKPARCPP